MITLAPATTLLTRTGLRVEVHSPANPAGTPGDNARAILDFVASNETLDRYGEIIAASGWRLENYRRNPVFQNAHQYGDVMFTLGKALITEVRPASPGSATPHLFQRIEFAVDVNPMARIAWGLYKGKFLNAVSVGFIPLRWETPAQPEKAGYRRKYLEQELLEVSAVGIPANPDALQLGLKAGAIEKADLQALLGLLRSQSSSFSSSSSSSGGGIAETKQVEDEEDNEFRSNPADPGTPAGASGARDNEAQLLGLARALREILRRT